MRSWHGVKVQFRCYHHRQVEAALFAGAAARRGLVADLLSDLDNESGAAVRHDADGAFNAQLLHVECFATTQLDDGVGQQRS